MASSPSLPSPPTPLGLGRARARDWWRSSSKRRVGVG